MLFKNHRNSYIKMSSSTTRDSIDQYSLLSPADPSAESDYLESCQMVAEPSPISPTKRRRRSNTAQKIAGIGRRFSILLQDSETARGDEEKRMSMQSPPQAQATSRERKRMSMPVQPQPQPQTSRAAKRMSLPAQLQPQPTPREKKRMSMMSMSVPEESEPTSWERKRMSLPVDLQSVQSPTREFRQRMETQYPIEEEAPVPRRRTTGDRLQSIGKRMSLNDPQIMSQAMWGYVFY
ncbi:hypothetical protein GGR57DRAFT_176805 [Xylariaceae sp. FL1272]|nr:hypothetical protein GGR57DRAFT_176805 [Xylariaceae sp. FL1272]